MLKRYSAKPFLRRRKIRKGASGMCSLRRRSSRRRVVSPLVLGVILRVRADYMICRCTKRLKLARIRIGVPSQPNHPNLGSNTTATISPTMQATMTATPPRYVTVTTTTVAPAYDTTNLPVQEYFQPCKRSKCV